MKKQEFVNIFINYIEFYEKNNKNPSKSDILSLLVQSKSDLGCLRFNNIVLYQFAEYRAIRKIYTDYIFNCKHDRKNPDIKIFDEALTEVLKTYGSDSVAITNNTFDAQASIALNPNSFLSRSAPTQYLDSHETPYAIP